MKSIILIGLFVFSFQAFSQNQIADKKTLFTISDIIKSCPEEFSKSLAQSETILTIVTRYSQNKQGQSVTKITMTTGLTATPMSPSEVVKNVVTVIKTPKAVQPIDGWLEDVVCKLN